MARRSRVWWVACVLPVVLVELSSCSDDPPASPAATAGDAAAERRDPPLDDADIPDAADAAKVPAPVLPGCIGTSLPLVPSGERAYVSVNLGGDGGAIRGDFLVDFGSNGSTIDLHAFTAPGPTPASCLGDAGAPGALCTFDNFDFFGPWGTVSLVTGDYSFLINSVKQAGIIGTDFVSVYPFTLEYTNARISKGSPTSFCTDAQLLGAGMVPIPAGGFYTNKPSTLRPLSDVITDPDASTAGFSVPNVPTVPIAIAGVSALAQLDTGYDDRITRHSVNINEAMLAQLLAKSPDKLKRRSTKDLFLTTCIPGLSQHGTAYELAAGTAVSFVAAGGAIGRNDTGTILFVKERLPDAERCGGIETWTVPAAQMAPRSSSTRRRWCSIRSRRGCGCRRTDADPAQASAGTIAWARKLMTARTRFGTPRPWLWTSETGKGSHVSSGSTSTMSPRRSDSCIPERGDWMIPRPATQALR